jgi:UDP-N-acetylmuramate dehydrogenase
MQKSTEFRILENYSLKEHNSFGIMASARYYISFSDIFEMQDFIKSGILKDIPWMVLGGGSNILFTKNFEGLVIHPLLKGFKVLSETDEMVTIQAAAGEIWDDFVKYAVDNNLYGLENLSLIPGSVGASPIQNIGAYGAEVAELIKTVKGIDLDTGKKIEYERDECHFGYRDSIFKSELKNKFLITSVTFKLFKKSGLRLDYGNLREEAERLGKITLQNVRLAVVNIRNSKLPDPAIIGNAGSFFKNPVVSNSVFESIICQYPDTPFFKVSDDLIKIPAGWLIEKCGLKGKTQGNVGVHDKQALIIVNKGNATGKEIFEFSESILQCVLKTFGIKLEREVNII